MKGSLLARVIGQGTPGSASLGRVPADRANSGKPEAAPREAKSRKAASLRPVWSLTFVLAGVAATLGFAANGLPGAANPAFMIPWWAFAPAVLAAEGLMFHVERKAQTHSFNLSEIPLVVGFFF